MDEIDILQKQYDEQVEKLNSLVTEVINHQHPEIEDLREEFKIVSKIAFVRNAITALELFLGKY